MEMIEKLQQSKFYGRKYTITKVNGDYVFVSVKSKNKTLGSNATDKYKLKRKIKNKIQKKSRSINNNKRS